LLAVSRNYENDVREKQSIHIVKEKKVARGFSSPAAPTESPKPALLPKETS
jgi:hypothetical protein